MVGDPIGLLKFWRAELIMKLKLRTSAFLKVLNWGPNCWRNGPHLHKRPQRGGGRGYMPGFYRRLFTEICLLRISLMVRILTQPLIKVAGGVVLFQQTLASSKQRASSAQQQPQMRSAALALAFSPAPAPVRLRASGPVQSGGKMWKIDQKLKSEPCFHSTLPSLGDQGTSDHMSQRKTVFVGLLSMFFPSQDLSQVTSNFSIHLFANPSATVV